MVRIVGSTLILSLVQPFARFTSGAKCSLISIVNACSCGVRFDTLEKSSVLFSIESMNVSMLVFFFVLVVNVVTFLIT